MKAAVCDASVLFKLLVVEEDSEKANELLASSQLTTSELAFAEIGNVLWSRVRSGRFDVGAAQVLMEKLHTLPLDVRPIRPFPARALSIAAVLDHPIYDCLYLALAENLGIPLVTADRRFLVAVHRARWQAVEVIALNDAV
jgi:predicted nucleic acid-binding protein